ncbi:protein NUCLEAR FUSION DEFECTIVE 4 isoform X1 [Selaginella moellendorffii]|uniref:protein NUCLEAR FUSION DEFECTIVE 4 isoform X1 n=1 Tax=Selaginella moellendorffii TaxID=88036 RepID=UPI000D1C834B|nr:protein NUCLEAR FUSION DEFECTIVE 4 isoform X1 [Selaginella moellendorffii]|eukprot:XP_024524340.1 protein NUCLEAR FUSION DEFECTIVE 4 isoform X1 [Selaginella moellendorffii]
MGRGLQRSRWMGLCVGMWMQACGGISYAFSLYSADLKQVMGYNQELIDALGTAKDIGGNVGIVSGLLIDRTSASFVLLVGGLMHLSFYSMLYLASTKQIFPTHWQMCGIIMLGTNGATWFNTAVLVTCMRNFPSDRGVVVGLLKGFIGLSGAIFTQVYTAIYAPHTGPFLLFCATFPPMVALVSMLYIRPIDPPRNKDESDDHKFTMLYITGLVLAFYLMCIILLQDFFAVRKAASQFFMFIMLLILLVPGAISLHPADGRQKIHPDTDSLFVKTPKMLKNSIRNPITVDVGHRIAELRNDGAVNNGGLPGSPSKSKLRLGSDYTLTQAVRTEDFWLLFFAMGCGTGSGLTAINNLAQMAESLNSKSIGAFVALVSVWNFLGRLGSGYISEFFMKRSGTPRPVFLLIVQALMGSAHLLFASSVPSLLYGASILVGLAHGAHWTLMVATSSELFGLKNFGALYNTLSISSTIGSYVLSVKLAGYLYDQQAAAANVRRCKGPQCFRLTFLIMALVCLIGCVALVRLVSRTRLVYRDIQRLKAASR